MPKFNGSVDVGGPLHVARGAEIEENVDINGTLDVDNNLSAGSVSTSGNATLSHYVHPATVVNVTANLLFQYNPATHAGAVQFNLNTAGAVLTIDLAAGAVFVDGQELRLSFSAGSFTGTVVVWSNDFSSAPTVPTCKAGNLGSVLFRYDSAAGLFVLKSDDLVLKESEVKRALSTLVGVVNANPSGSGHPITAAWIPLSVLLIKEGTGGLNVSYDGVVFDVDLGSQGTLVGRRITGSDWRVPTGAVMSTEVYDVADSSELVYFSPSPDYGYGGWLPLGTGLPVTGKATSVVFAGDHCFTSVTGSTPNNVYYVTTLSTSVAWAAETVPEAGLNIRTMLGRRGDGPNPLAVGVVGSTGQVWRRTGAGAWSQVLSAPGNALLSGVSTSAGFYVAGVGDRFWSSADGVTWSLKTPSSLASFVGAYWRKLVDVNGVLVGLLAYPSAKRHTIVFSVNNGGSWGYFDVMAPGYQSWLEAGARSPSIVAFADRILYSSGNGGRGVAEPGVLLSAPIM